MPVSATRPTCGRKPAVERLVHAADGQQHIEPRLVGIDTAIGEDDDATACSTASQASRFSSSRRHWAPSVPSSAG